MSNPKNGDTALSPGDSGGSHSAAPSGVSRGSAVLTGEDLSTAYNLGLRNNNELMQQQLLDQVNTKAQTVRDVRGYHFGALFTV